MRIAVDHVTTYRFSTPQARLVQMLRLTPEDTLDQTVAGWSLHVDCDARMRAGRDGFGNRITMLYVEGPIEHIEIQVSGQVLTNSADGVVHGTHEPLPPALFLRSTPLTIAEGALAKFAEASAVGDSSAERLTRLNVALFERVALDPGRPAPGITAAAAFARPIATIRDMAQMFVAGARYLGVPARYVSGYRPDARARSTPHGWAEAYIEGTGWMTFDPSSGQPADESYVRVAVALDSAGAATVAGSRLGEGDEELDVDLTVEPSNGQ